MTHNADAYEGLLQQVRNDLLLQHPEWTQPNGQCPMCDFYEARLIELLLNTRRPESECTTRHGESVLGGLEVRFAHG